MYKDCIQFPLLLHYSSCSSQVGLALVVEGEIVLGVMGCPNWHEEFHAQSSIEFLGNQETISKEGIIMIAHVGCGTWRKGLSKKDEFWNRCFVDECILLLKGRFCISDSQEWDSLPLSESYDATTIANDIEDKEILLLPTCCGRLAIFCLL